MFSIVVDIELADGNFIRKLGFCIHGNVPGYSICPPKRYKAKRKQAYWCTKKLHEVAWNNGFLNYRDLQNVLPAELMTELFAEENEKCKILNDLMNKDMENLTDHGCPKTQELVESDKGILICSIYQFGHKTTLHRVEQKANSLVTGGQFSSSGCNFFCFVIVSVYVIKKLKASSFVQVSIIGN